MRRRFEVNHGLSITPIESVKLPLKSRDELPAILSGLQWIFSNTELNEDIFKIIEKKVIACNNTIGRPGMDLWHIFVLATVRLGLDIDFDKLEDLANHHKLLRLILGVESIWSEKVFNYRTINDNVSLLDEDTLKAINLIVANHGRLLLNHGKPEMMNLKADSYVLECNVHFPTDLNLTWDSLKKCISLIIKDKDLYMMGGWRKHSLWNYELKKTYLKCIKTVFGGGKNKKLRVKKRTTDFLAVCRKISGKILTTRTQAALHGINIPEMDYFHGMIDKHIDLVCRRLLKGEDIPHIEKVFSVFESHTECLSKGKKNPTIELGQRVMIATESK